MTSYEVGWKGSAINRRLALGARGVRADYEDVQVPGSEGRVINGIPTFIGVTTNAGKARFQGVELEANMAIAETWQLRAIG